MSAMHNTHTFLIAASPLNNKFFDLFFFKYQANMKLPLFWR